MENTVYIGIDIARKKFDAVIYAENTKGRHAVFDNTGEGFECLLSWIATPAKHCHIAMEATNTYWEMLAYFLTDKGCTVSVINPKCIKAYAKGLNMRHKTDRLDAALIARYAAKERPKCWTPPQQNIRELLLLQRQIAHLQCRLQGEHVRLGMIRSDEVGASIKRHIAYLEKEIARVEGKAKALIQRDEQLKSDAALLSTIPAIGAKTLPWLLAYLWDGKRFNNAKAAASYAGLTPMFRESGSSVSLKPRISKIGHSEIRRALYMPAMVFSYGRYKGGAYQDFVQRLEANGKSKKEVIVALMRKLLTIAQAVLQYQKPFDISIHKKGFSEA